MEGGGGVEDGERKKKKVPEGEGKSKRQMKTASQLEILEKTYAVETYPSEALRAELSAQLGLSDRQLQMWFCHRRLKDRKGQQVKRPRGKDSPVAAGTPVREEMGGGVELESEMPPGSASGSSPFGHGIDPRRSVVVRTPGVAVPRISADVQAMKRYYEPQQSVAELRAIAFVEAQLGEPLREDGPVLGMEFDPLPPDAFGAPIGTAAVGQQKQHSRPFEANLYERPDVKPIKVQGTTRALHEYQFLPQQPSVKADTYERVPPSYPYGSPIDGHNAKTAGLPSARPFTHANEQISTGYGFPSPIPSLNLMPQEGRQGHILPPATGEYETVPRKNSYSTGAMEAQIGTHPITTIENPFISSERRVFQDEDALRMERKRKSEEARIAREVEAHEKRIRKELEKQDILRRKREEQMRKEMERHDRERRKEEERLLREKQREEERLLREQRREMERREKFLQKESIRAEKLRQKEEQRREKEAARQKAASERAIARKMAKESMELVEDERLELMELASSSKGLPSVSSLDFETLQNLDIFRDKLSVFPPKSVLLKKPFSIQPWKNPEENVGNLLMAWRFIITFVDVLAIWPFTLDEFVQAFHDYDPRLLGEIHIALLRTIIKDIEDVARTPATGLGTNQNSAANLGGGHPEIVEGAYTWGFDIRSWHRHLNPLTWPEILRQFALSAGFGPQLKKKSIDQAHTRDENEGNDGEDVITNLRSGAAVENAVAIMQERGFSNQRRSRHRLTPGTVKFAAFHVLSLEGSKGLTILEVAERIQKSGLRDLTTSKTPEASIAAALSRDSKLFERTAPSTYCVRVPYRKDPADAEAILSAARERIRVFKSGLIDGEDADDAERDEDSDSDVAEDPEVDDLGADLNLKKEEHDSPEVNKFSAKTSLDNGKDRDEVIRTPQVDIKGAIEDLPTMHTEGNNEDNDVDAKVDTSNDVARSSSILGQEGTDIDESNPGEPWVQGLMEGEYSDLSVEERLNALVALINVAIEGNSIRVVLEERLEAANALKKQMWAEAQLDKRRMKEDYVTRTHYSLYGGNKMENNLAISAEVRQSPSVTADEKAREVFVAAAQHEQSSDQQNDISSLNMLTEANPHVQEFTAGPENLLYQQPGHATEKSRSQLKSFIGHKAEEMYVYRSLPLGQDRRRNRYWQFITSASHNDPGCGRIFVELHNRCWRLIDSEKGFDALLASLDVRGIRESHLHTMLQKIEISFKDTIRMKRSQANMEGSRGDIFKKEAVEMAGVTDDDASIDSPSSVVCGSDSDASEASTSFAIELGKNQNERNHMFTRYQEFENWMWKECFDSSILCATKYGKKRGKALLGACDNCHDIYLEDNHCSCTKTNETTRYNLNSQYMTREEKLEMNSVTTLLSPTSPLRIKLLKMLVALIEVSVLPESLKSVWTKSSRKSWGMKLHSSSSAEDLLQLLTILEGAIEKDFLSTKYETTSELLGLSNPSGFAATDSPNTPVPVLPWLPLTTAAVALRVVEFDASISYMLHQKVEPLKDKGSGNFKLPSKYAVVKNTQDMEIAEASRQSGFFGQESWNGAGTGLAGLAHGRTSRGRSRSLTLKKSQRKVNGSNSKSKSVKRKLTMRTDRLEQALAWKGRQRPRGGLKRGRRSVRSRQKVVKQAVETVAERNIPKQSIFDKSQRSLVRNDWRNDRDTRFKPQTMENGSSSERSEYEDENGQATGDESDDLGADDYTIGFNHKSDDLMEGSDYNADANLDANLDDEDVDDEDDEEPGEMDVEEYINEDSDDGVRGGGDQMGDPDEEMGSSSSSDFSD